MAKSAQSRAEALASSKVFEQVAWSKFLGLTAYGRLGLILYRNPKLVSIFDHLVDVGL
jgi:hypothetical protein